MSQAFTPTDGVTRAPLSARRDDLYETPPQATEALLRAEAVPPLVWEPACGPGAIARVLRRHGHVVVASDLVDYATEDQDFARWDFLLEERLPKGTQAIVTNPPYKLVMPFVARALALCPYVAMLLRLQFLEGSGTERSRLLDGGRLARVHVFRNRLPRMHRAGWVGTRATNRVAFAWFVWDAAHHGPTELRRLSWDDFGSKENPRAETRG
jgi:hypothetical protein